MIAAAWTDDRVTMLKNLWEKGLSASQIAAELGNVTRNAVIGKVSRLGLCGTRAKCPADAGRHAHKVRPRRRKVAIFRPRTALAHVAAVEAEPDHVEALVIPIHQRRSLLELNDAVCHWPVGNPGEADFHFCGGKALPSLPYCAHHSRIAYPPPKPRVREVSRLAKSHVDNDWRR